jgi:hypothetical protein
MFTSYSALRTICFVELSVLHMYLSSLCYIGSNICCVNVIRFLTYRC